MATIARLAVINASISSSRDVELFTAAGDGILQLLLMAPLGETADTSAGRPTRRIGRWPDGVPVDRSVGYRDAI